MDARHWDELAPRYETEVFNVLAHDCRGLIAERIQAAGGPRRIASDLGCGPGRFLPLLSQSFRRVYAVDHSERLLEIARTSHPELENVRYLSHDIARLADRIPEVHCALSVNALLTPSLEQQRQTLDFYAEHVRPGGTLLLVVPALESAHLVRQILIEWDLRSGARSAHALEEETMADTADAAGRLLRGVLDVGGVPTKHFSREELMALLGLRKFRIREVTKLEYPWATEFTDPPEWLQAPYPWDWIVVAERVRQRSRRRGQTASAAR